MFGNKDGKPVDITVTESTYVEGRLVQQGTVLRACDPQLALELVSAGRARALRPEDEAKKGKAAG